MTSENDTSDSDIEVLVNYVALEHDNVRRLRDRANFLIELNDEEFRNRFRLTKVSVVEILNKIQPSLEYGHRRNRNVSPLHQLLIALRFYATESFQVKEL